MQLSSQEKVAQQLPECLEAHHPCAAKGSMARIVPVDAELHTALTSALQFGNIGQDDRLIMVSWSTPDRWIKAAAARAGELGAIPPGRQLSNHTLGHSYARHLLVYEILINHLSRWLGHSSIQTTLIHLELVQDPTGSLAAGRAVRTSRTASRRHTAVSLWSSSLPRRWRL